MIQIQSPVSRDLRWNELNVDLKKFIAGKIRNHADAEDILQEVLLKIHKSADRVPPDRNLFAWIYAIARNTITDHYRKPQRTVSLETAAESPDDVREETVPRDALGEIAHCLQPFIDHVPEKYREALVLTDLEGMTQTDLAARLGLSVSGAKSRVQRARAILKGRLLDCCHVEYNGAGRVVDYACKTPQHCEPGAVTTGHSGRK